MDITYFKDLMFDVLNESDALDLQDIRADDKNDRFTVVTWDGTSFIIRIEKE